MVQEGASTPLFNDSCCAGSSNQMNQNQFFFHLLFCIAMNIASCNMTKKNCSFNLRQLWTLTDDVNRGS